MCSTEVTETMAEWEARMEATGSRPPKGPFVEWVTDGHGHMLDPEADVMDQPAQKMVASRQK